ncbi:DUF1642 domain-containing protein [Enterococcus lactis]|uniref:DUF1642 domain-containing protein n=1 Tax=Enterococcus TaxID=1350 RepID=UPI00241217EB|nr:DUF1642 domain-containing protein [Enterococcus lactis]EKS9950385.1 DUF1642 domain-containing protein [Enterococcus faecium]MDQ8222101.1 DUF1642 domain-containing protein [Enterococcus faecium]MDQ8222165.1 DUF1642 domain-containing protein [Enterococcus faecium]
MNKQELIERYKTKYAEEPKDWKHPSVNASRQDLFANFIRDLKQLDEPQKPKTEVFNHDEKFVVEWLDHTTEYHYSLYNAINDAGSEFRSWMKIGFNSNRFARAFMSMDYEVEKEPLYYVKLPVVYFNHWDLEAYLMKDDRGNITIADNNDFDDMKFTESEIKEIDERYWPFAVPVEEVAEG